MVKKQFAWLLLCAAVLSIACSSEDDPGQEPGPGVVHVTSVKVDPPTLSLKPGEGATLSATVLPANADDLGVTWSTANAAVATVAGGVVRAVAPGTAVITVTTRNGAFSASCKVTVAAPQSSALVGEWKLTTWAASPGMAGKVWVAFKADNTFALYQLIGTAGYSQFTGTYIYDVAAQSLSGVYSDGRNWARNYSVEALTATQLTLGDVLQPSDVSVYARETIPGYVKDGVTGKAVRADVERFL